MEPNKLDIKIKEKLDSREIQPSEMAWNKLDAMLTAHQKPKRRFSWIYFAASFIGFILLGTAYLSQRSNQIIDSKNEVVFKSVINTNNIEDSLNVLKTNKDKNPKIVYNNSLQAANKSSNRSIRKEKSKLITSNSNQLLIARSMNNPDSSNSAQNLVKYTAIQSRTKNKYIAPEALLAEVSNTKFEIKFNELAGDVNKKRISISASNLLLEAETELNQSFKESAFNRLNKNYNTVRTVLVNRNYQQ